MQILPEGKTELLTSEVARDAYPLATYFHAKQSYFILGWRETGGETATTARHVPQRETRPITRSGATLTLQQPRVSGLGPPGILHPCPGDCLGADRRLRRARTGRR